MSELAEPFAISQPAVSRHVRVLAEAGLIVQRVEWTKRPCRLAPDALTELDEDLEMLRRSLEQNISASIACWRKRNGERTRYRAQAHDHACDAS